MTTRIDVIIFCSSHRKQKFQSTFEEQQPGEWYCIKNVPIDPVPLIKKIASIFRRKTIPKATSVSSVTGSLFYDIPCPFCGGTHMVSCGNCGELSCHPSGTGDFKCPTCHNYGTLAGELRNLSGQTSKYQSKRKQ